MPTILILMVTCKDLRVRDALVINLRSLMKTELTLELTPACWRLQPVGGVNPEQLVSDPLCAGFVAAWKLYRYAPLSALRALDVKLPGVISKLTNLLLWASRFGSTMLDAGDDPGALADRSMILVGHLVAVSQWLYHSQAGIFPVASAEEPSGRREQLGILWCNAFAPLLRLQGPLSMDYSLLLQIARSRSLPNPGWPGAVAALCRLVHNVFTPDAMEILQDPRFWSQVADGAEGSIPSDIANTLVTSPALPPSLQSLLLFPPRPMTVDLGPGKGPPTSTPWCTSFHS
jgi:hypothetical protein